MFDFYGQPEHFLPVVHGGPEVWPPPAHEHMADTSNISVLGDLTASGISGTSGHGHGSTSSSSSPLAATLVGSQGGLQINLLWDSSVASAPPGFTTEVEDAASYLTTLFSNHEVINIQVGWGEAAGSSLPSNALGESVSNGYLTNYATLEGALHAPSAANDPTTSQFFVASAEAKALGLVNSTSSTVDGYIGFGTLSNTGYSWNSGSSVGANQFDIQAVAEHEISEVMGRIGMEGQPVNHHHTYTPLDLFNYSPNSNNTNTNTLELSAKGGYFSTNGGQNNLGTFNDAAVYGGDIADWASPQSGTQGLTPGNYDAFNAFAGPGQVGQVTTSDISELAALGYRMTGIV